MEERREHQRCKALESIAVTIRAEDSNLHTEGFILNISKDGAYVFADSIPFRTGQVAFEFKDGLAIRRRCRRIYPHNSKARGQAIEFIEPLTDEEFEALKAPIVE